MPLKVSRAANPFCVFWDTSENQWSIEGVETDLPVTQIQTGEIKQFSVNCLSNHLTAFGIAVDVNTEVSILAVLALPLHIYFH